ncbi:MAG TPA: hemerythrin domain-containing protein [Planctomycetes bacterium]|nr:hemerythrin domain-containing protein [Planctomycetota bacterium]
MGRTRVGAERERDSSRISRAAGRNAARVPPPESGYYGHSVPAETGRLPPRPTPNMSTPRPSLGPTELPTPATENNLASTALAAFLRQHVRQEELLRSHRLAVMALDASRAHETLEAFAEAVRCHMEIEEEVLLPLYGERVHQPPRFGVAIYRRDHEKISAGLERVRLSLERFAKDPTPEAALFHTDFSHALVHLMEHHDERERAAFFPLLDRSVEARELDAILRADPRAGVG